jgi:hypothetical protein
MRTLLPIWLTISAIFPACTAPASTGPAQRVSLDLRIATDLTQPIFTDILRSRPATWLLLDITPDEQSKNYGNITRYFDPLSHETKPLLRATGGIVSVLVGVASVKAVLAGKSPGPSFTYAWAEPVDVGSEANKSGPPTIISQGWPFKFQGGLALCRCSAALSGPEMFPAVYALPSEFAPFVKSGYDEFKRNPGLYDPQFSIANDDELRRLVTGANTLLACLAANLLSSPNDSSFFAGQIQRSQGFLRAVLVAKAICGARQSPPDTVALALDAAVEHATSPDDLHYIALGLVLGCEGRETTSARRDLAASVFQRMSSRLARLGTTDEYLNVLAAALPKGRNNQ